MAQESETSTAIEEEEQPKVCLSHALSSFTPRCHPIDQDITGAQFASFLPLGVSKERQLLTDLLFAAELNTAVPCR